MKELEKKEMRIILASASPRRRELLSQLGVEFEVCPSQGEEKITSHLLSAGVLRRFFPHKPINHEPTTDTFPNFIN